MLDGAAMTDRAMTDRADRGSSRERAEDVWSPSRLTLGIDGTETFDVLGARTPRTDLTLVIHRKNGERVEVPVTCRLDTAEEVAIYEAGGVLQRFAQDFLESSAPKAAA